MFGSSIQTLWWILLYVIPVAVAWVSVSALLTLYWFCSCSAVLLSYITSCGASCSYWLVLALFSCCSPELISSPTPVLIPSNVSTQKQQILNSCFLRHCFFVYIVHDILVWFMVFVSIWLAFICLIRYLASLQCLSQVVSTLESTQLEVLANNYRFWAKLFPTFPFHWLVVVMDVGKITNQDFP